MFCNKEFIQNSVYTYANKYNISSGIIVISIGISIGCSKVHPMTCDSCEFE